MPETIGKLRKLLLACVLVCGSSYWLVQPWQIDFWNDVPLYQQKQRFLQDETIGWPGLVITPFYSDAGQIEIRADASRPVYMALLNLWGSAYRALSPKWDRAANRSQFFGFTFLCFILLFLAIARLGQRLGGFWTGIVGAAISLFNPWSFVFLYYAAYLQLSMTLFIMAFLLVLQNQPRWMLAAGAVSAFALLSNLVLAVYLAGLGLVIWRLNASDLKKAVWKGMIFAAGFLSVFLLLEAFKWTGVPQRISGFSRVDSPVETLQKYYKWSAEGANEFVLRRALRSAWEKHKALHPDAIPDAYSGVLEHTPKYPGILFIFLSHTSWTLLSALFLLAVFLIREGFRKQARLSHPKLFSAACLLIPCVAAFLILDLSPMVQLGRAYFVGFPLLVMSALYVWNWMSEHDIRFQRAGAWILILFMLETSLGLADERRAFHAFSDTIHQSAKLPYCMLKNDLLAQAIPNLMTEEQKSRHYFVQNTESLALAVAQRGDAYLIAGPDIETVLSNSSPEFKVPDLPGGAALYSGQNFEVRASDPVRIPFYGVYPLLNFEDEFDMWRYLALKEFNRHDFKDGSGAITMWRISRVSKGERLGFALAVN